MQIIRTKELAFLSTAFMLLMAVVMTACSSEDNTTNQPEPVTGDTPKTYTLTIEATKGGASQEQNGTRSSSAEAQPALGEAKGEATTRALSIDNTGALIATWKTGDQVSVYKSGNTEKIGTLSPVKLGSATTTLSGSITGTVNKGDELLLCFPHCAFEYTNQQGRLNGTTHNIEDKNDFCSATVTVADVSDGGQITTTGKATFENQQAIVCFTLTEASTGDPIIPATLEIGTDKDIPLNYNMISGSSTTGRSLTITNGTGSNVIYAALRGFTDTNVTLTAHGHLSNVNYIYTKENVTFEHGKYYTVNVSMSRLKNQGYIFVSPSSQSMFIPGDGSDHSVNVSIACHGGDITFEITGDPCVSVEKDPNSTSQYIARGLWSASNYQGSSGTATVTFTCHGTEEYDAATATFTWTYPGHPGDPNGGGQNPQTPGGGDPFSGYDPDNPGSGGGSGGGNPHAGYHWDTNLGDWIQDGYHWDTNGNCSVEDGYHWDTNYNGQIQDGYHYNIVYNQVMSDYGTPFYHYDENLGDWVYNGYHWDPIEGVIKPDWEDPDQPL